MRKYEIIEINPALIKNISKNARYMSQTEFKRLVNNIKKDGQLTSVPFCVPDPEEENTLVVVSGNHRVKASVAAGLTKISVMVGYGLSNDHVRAIQLSHNSIAGKDDLQILKEIFDEIAENGYKEYSFIDTSVFDELDKIDVDIVQPSNEFINIAFTFFEPEISKFEDIVMELRNTTARSEITIPMPKAQYEIFTKTVSNLKKEFDIKDYGATIILMAELAQKFIQQFVPEE